MIDPDLIDWREVTFLVWYDSMSIAVTPCESSIGAGPFCRVVYGVVVEGDDAAAAAAVVAAIAVTRVRRRSAHASSPSSSRLVEDSSQANIDVNCS